MSFEERVAGALRQASREAYGVELTEVHVERPNDPVNGDLASNLALANAKAFRRNPREVAEKIAETVEAPFAARVEVAGPGFVNFWLTDEALCGELAVLLRDREGYGTTETRGEPVLLEYVSANPTGPVHVAHGRHAAYGDSLARLLTAAGYPVTREFYFNDGGNQIRLLGESVAVRYAALHGTQWPVEDPDALYRGGYIEDIARDLSAEHGERYLAPEDAEALTAISDFAADWCMAGIKKTLDRIRSPFDGYFNEKSLYDSGAVDGVVERLRESGHAYEEDGALWLASSGLGDDKDRVLVKSDGTYTYMAPDLAYHLDKHERGYGVAVDILGADHAGYPPRIRAGLAALGVDAEFLEVEIVRLVKLLREGAEVKVSKRAGNFVTLDELVDEVGEDVARYFFVRSSHKTEMNFDLDLAIRQSEENPVFYVQYAHARIASIFGRAGVSPESVEEVPTGRLAAEERALLLELLDFPRVVRNAAEKREVHPLPTYLETLATRYHQFYTVHRVLVDDGEVQRRRLALSAATKSVLASGLGMLGVVAPEKM
ncbi:arginine--tRNA ligase [Rubrobacter aplysinae]|uniref:arginine--tRNA ligase n=1 Tax=Rubrobacter aplysinae TaxID=909625 RepID=UPI00064C1F62|nr:arginine--tRNA ligase [Rubrobacter aplysinae]